MTEKSVAPPQVKDRPRCPCCNKVLVPEMYSIWGAGEDGRQTIIGRTWSGNYKSYGPFCSLRCGCRFGQLAYRAGYRRKS